MSNPIEKGLRRLAWQFTDSLNFKAFIEAFLSELKELDDSGEQLLLERYLDTAVGAQLDGIGEIVGLPRPTAPNTEPGFFGFVNDPTALGFGDLYDPLLGGHFISFDLYRVIIDDDTYRHLIRAKIIKNQTAMTVEDTIRLISFLYGEVEVRYFLEVNLLPRYDIGKILSDFEKELLETFLPTLIGIDKVNYHTVYTSTPFSFAEDINGLGFGDINDPLLGGDFARILDTAT